MARKKERERFEERLLLKLHRKYSTDEALKLAIEEFRKAKVEIGKLKSEIFELEYKLKKYEEENQLSPSQIQQLKTKGWVKDLLTSERINELNHTVAVLKAKQPSNTIKKYKKDAEHWRDKYFELLATNNIKK